MPLLPERTTAVSDYSLDVLYTHHCCIMKAPLLHYEGMLIMQEGRDTLPTDGDVCEGRLNDAEALEEMEVEASPATQSVSERQRKKKKKEKKLHKGKGRT